MPAGRQGFTLIELMVSVSIIVVLIGMGAASMSQFYARDKIISAKSEVISVLKMARNYAVTDQSPADYGPQLDAVAVVLDITTRQLSVVPMNSINLGVGKSYSATKITDSEVNISWNELGTNLIFSTGTGKLLKIVGPITEPVAFDYVKVVSISTAGTGETAVIKIDAMGVISGQ